MAFIFYRRMMLNLQCLNLETHEMRCFGLEMKGGMLGVALGFRALLDYKAEFKTWDSLSKLEEATFVCSPELIVTPFFGLFDWLSYCRFYSLLLLVASKGDSWSPSS